MDPARHPNGVAILCSNETGTVTKHQLTLGDPVLCAGKDDQDCIQAAALASQIEDRDAIDTAWRLDRLGETDAGVSSSNDDHQTGEKRVAHYLALIKQRLESR